MEQQIDPKTKIEIGVGTDPAFIPGLTGPSPAVKDRKEEDGTEVEPADETPAASNDGAEDGAGDGADEDAEEGAEEPAGESAEENSDDDSDDSDDDTDGATGDDTAADAAAGSDGPVFRVSDRRGSIAAGPSGVRFTLDDQEAEFGWDEIGAVEVKPARFGRRFTVTVHMAANRWFNADVEAPARSQLKEWTAELDAVLDAYFDEG
ncbi:hypothetical protein [Streptomyces sp. NPDC003023]|uniref:hypothetical protein n=1 Tax=Streptomyces sp. NPDC003023 TaxID=3364675 RepID=UPI0036A39D9B